MGMHYALAAVCIAAFGLSTVAPQVVEQFVPDEVAVNISGRVVFRQEGLVGFWKNPVVRTIVIRDTVELDEAYWRSEFQDTGGVAVLGAERPEDFTIKSDELSDSGSELNFSHISGAILVQQHGLLRFVNITLADIAPFTSYQYGPAQPYRNAGLGWGLWPTITLAPGGQVSLRNVYVAYRNPSRFNITCEQYTQNTVYALQQQFGAGNVTAASATAIRFSGPLDISVEVLNGIDNSTVGTATAVYQDVTFDCMPKLNADASSTSGTALTSGTLAAVITVPIVALALVVAGIICCKSCKRHTAAAGKLPCSICDIELGLHRCKDADVRGATAGISRARLQPATSAALSTAPSQASVLRSTSGGSYPSSSTALSSPALLPTPAWRNSSSNSTSGSLPAVSADTASSSQLGGIKEHGGNFRSSAAPLAFSRVNTASISQSDASTPATASRQTSAGSGSGADVAATHTAVAGLQSATSSGSGSTTPGSSGRGRGTSSVRDSVASAGARPSAARGDANEPALLKARSDMAVLRDLKIGPLLGRGSYGRVYKGRWKTVTVAVKIIEHDRHPTGHCEIDCQAMTNQETLLATNIAHPNVVQTYHISTMTVSQRNGLANSWSKEQGLDVRADSARDSLFNRCRQFQGEAEEASGSSCEEVHRDSVETWMLMEFCEKGSLERAISQGRFVRKDSGKPEMIGIYKALLDTASGLDYLHSIGVVHGDLKTANVLLKGSTRDVRGFACKITDFGLSRVLDLDATHISTRTHGTIVYMPAELLQAGCLTQATDIYSFGLMMWELYTSSSVLDEGLSIGQIFYMIVYQNWRPSVPAGCPADYADLMQACWHQDPEQRPTAQQLVKMLRKLYSKEKKAAAAADVAGATGTSHCLSAATRLAASAVLATPVPAQASALDVSLARKLSKRVSFDEAVVVVPAHTATANVSRWSFDNSQLRGSSTRAEPAGSGSLGQRQDSGEDSTLEPVTYHPFSSTAFARTAPAPEAPLFPSRQLLQQPPSAPLWPADVYSGWQGGVADVHSAPGAFPLQAVLQDVSGSGHHAAPVSGDLAAAPRTTNHAAATQGFLEALELASKPSASAISCSNASNVLAVDAAQREPPALANSQHLTETCHTLANPQELHQVAGVISRFGSRSASTATTPSLQAAGSSTQLPSSSLLLRPHGACSGALTAWSVSTPEGSPALGSRAASAAWQGSNATASAATASVATAGQWPGQQDVHMAGQNTYNSQQAGYPALQMGEGHGEVGSVRCVARPAGAGSRHVVCSFDSKQHTVVVDQAGADAQHQGVSSPFVALAQRTFSTGTDYQAIAFR